MREFTYYKPASITELKQNLNQPGDCVLAGGTDIIPKMRRGGFQHSILVDTSGISALRLIEDHGNLIVIGALTTQLDLERSQLLRNFNPALADAAHSIDCSQTRSRGTLGGNISSSSPAGDTIPPLLVYDASLPLQVLEQEAFVQAGAVQCGYCTPGAILTAKALLDENPRPTDQEIREGLSGNLCRCTGYHKMPDALHLVLDEGENG